jgi:hypothetical protein
LAQSHSVFHQEGKHCKKITKKTAKFRGCAAGIGLDFYAWYRLYYLNGTEYDSGAQRAICREICRSALPENRALARRKGMFPHFPRNKAEH